jgi:hypothetical protein
MMIKNKWTIMYMSLLLYCVSFISCGYSKKDAEKYLPGQYSYKIPSGEIQLLDINADFTFKQIIYYKNMKGIMYENVGEMYVDGDKIEFKNWLECYEPADQKILSKPHIVYSIGNYWRKPKRNEGVVIVKFDQTNYIFRKK